MPLYKDDPKSIGGYRLVGRLGSGGMGVVYRGRARSGREVAVKVVHAQYAEDPVFRTRFRQEIEAVRKVSGAFTAPVLDADPEAVRPWMATQYVPGPSLAARIRDGGPLKGTELRRLALGLVEALRDIHRAGVVHRDLKPANVLMAEDGPRVIDFGISRAAENHNTLTETGQMIGTPPFMSPEQLTDARSVGPASDVFSLGALLVFTITGKGPFDADSPYLTAYRVVHDAPVLDGVPGPFQAILERCLAKEPADRPELDALEGEFVATLPETGEDDQATVTLRSDEVAMVRTRPAEPPGRRRVRPLWATAGTVGALALGLTGYLLLGPGDDGAPAGAGAGAAAPSRWAAVPSGWKPWQTTVDATAAHGVKKGTAEGSGLGGGPECRLYEGAVYCAGDGVLPMRLDGATGRTDWRADALPSGRKQGTYNYSVLGVEDDAMLVRQEHTPVAGGDSSIMLAALDTGTGEPLWHRTLTGGPMDATVSGGLVVMPAGGEGAVTARSPRTGAVRWTATLPAGQYCDPTGVGADLLLRCGPEMAPSKEALLLTLDRTDGTARRLAVPNRGRLVGSYDGRLLFLDLAEDEQGNVSGDGAQGPFSLIRLIDPDTGEARSTKLAEEFEGRVTLADGTLWFVTSSGQVTAASARTGERLWQTRTSLEQPSGVTYDPRARVVYLASASGRVAALDTKKGTPLWETLPRAQRVTSQGGLSQTEVLLHKGALVVATPDGDVFTLDPAHPDRKPVSG
ncbi:protein kinase domain-containing protein [Streptomyces lanatus]|uniref:PQQ-binding-like beta-propeller repeat protein n=1 Tax=Streptomyces lanatus TaxID=66900 RepID=A0ABV1XPC1_9ACTN|nr:serine/threonine-protein kinase [Streptomyces lanatus]GHH01768.1 serine/threonine protein kinase [Streptomyces lanatus]